MTWLNESDVEQLSTLSNTVISMYLEEIQVSSYLNNASCSRVSHPSSAIPALGWTSGTEMQAL